ncbi:MAG TPA: NAD(+)/NADH kinase [Desulfomonilaceae bacterium]|nr:NAD(+)/NADH kinase [Desulfomonilaceae bacterium]
MQRIGMVLKRSEQQALMLGEKISAFLKDSGKEVLLEPSLGELAERWDARATDRLTDDSDLLVVLGGDGTILRAASLLNDRAVPVLGVNLGRVGFMAEVLPDEAIPMLRSALEGTAEFVKRMLLQVTLPGGKQVRVLNDVVIHWGGIARLIELDIKLGESRDIELRADGLIIATPIGSSAYSYAANGPLLHPEIEGILMTPICPYAGLKRPLVIPPYMNVELLLKRGENLTLTLDGHTTADLNQGETIGITRATIPFIMVQSSARDYFHVLKQKLGLL